MSLSQLRILLPWQSLKASPLPENESPGRSFEPTDEVETSASAADTTQNIRHQPAQSPEIKPEQPPLATALAPERSETMPPSKSHKAGKVHSQPPPNSRAKNRSRTASKPSPPSKAIPQSSVASNKSPSTSGKDSLSQDTSKPSSPAGKSSRSQDASSKPSSPAAVAATAPRSRITSKPSSPSSSSSPSSQTSSKNHPKPSSQSRFKADSQPSSSRSAFPSQDSSLPPRLPSLENSRQPSERTSRVQSPSHFSSKPTAQSTSQQPNESPAVIGIQSHPNSKPSSQSRFKADSQPSSSSRSAFSSQDSSMLPWSPSRENSRQQPLEKTSRVQSPSHLSSKPAQSTSQQPIESPAAIGNQTTNETISHPTNQSPKARPTSRESQMQTKSKQSLKPNTKQVELKASKNKSETKEELSSKNTSNPHSNQDSFENPTKSDQTIENSLDFSLESQAESRETEEELAKTTNALQTKASRSTLITSSKIHPSFEPEQQEESMDDSSKAFQKLNIKYSDEENPKSFTTLIGQNKGSSMHLVSGEAKSESSIHIHRQYKSNPDQSPKCSTEIEGNFINETQEDSRTEENPPSVEIYINLNVQGINNSIMCNTSFTENDPGIKLKLSRETIKSEDELESHHARKAEYSAKPAEKVTYEPRVRRRCLRGMLMESSDSEVENPGKSRRHGCRYGLSSKGKEVETL
ncbi:flocculation protein FLO11 [Benincasa hispida]|uniref:flocculation protein FLO11 n=1 Tax=Benincasa hispida TaxID=102211 RepID=UPI001901BC9A|nr:flocculation protein FLO11 [Benincasa hispida]